MTHKIAFLVAAVMLIQLTSSQSLALRSSPRDCYPDPLLPMALPVHCMPSRGAMASTPLVPWLATTNREYELYIRVVICLLYHVQITTLLYNTYSTQDVLVPYVGTLYMVLHGTSWHGTGVLSAVQ